MLPAPLDTVLTILGATNTRTRPADTRTFPLEHDPDHRLSRHKLPAVRRQALLVVRVVVLDMREVVRPLAQGAAGRQCSRLHRSRHQLVKLPALHRAATAVPLRTP